MSSENISNQLAIAMQEQNNNRSRFFDTVSLMVGREWRRLLMEPSRVFGVLLQPLLFLLVFGVGFNESFRLAESDVTYFVFFFPGILGLVVLFSSIYATLTLVDDKKCGFFRLVLSGPGGIKGAIFGKILATATLGLMQALLFTPLILLLPINVSALGYWWLISFLLLGSICFALIGVLFAWICETPSAFHALMSVILIPMWLLSGAMFPVSHGALSVLSFFNPMAYLVAGLRASLLATPAYSELIAILVFSIFTYAVLMQMLKKRPIE